jgi:hypothetical protein
MRGECTDKHVATLRRRYGDKRLREAALRREHLNYQRISIGHSPGSGRVKFLLAQMHQTYYFGFSESACILAGTLLEQGLIYALGAALDRRGPLPFSRGGEMRWLQTRRDLLDLELVDMLELAREEKVITEGKVLLLAHEVRWIRNMVVHEKIPLFRDHDTRHLEMKVPRSRRRNGTAGGAGVSSGRGGGRDRPARILLARDEVADLMRDGRAASGELTAYFCVSRTRMVLRHLFNHAGTEAKKNDESGGGLFLWAES